MASLEDFFVAPSVDVLNNLTKDQLRKVCEHYDFDLGLPRTAKLAQIRVSVQAELVVRNILSSPASLIMDELELGATSTPLSTEFSKMSLTFEQQKVLIEMQQKEREAQREAEQKEREAQREADRNEREAERQLEMERIRSERDVALERLRLVAEGRLSVDEGTAPMGFVRPSDISNMVRLLPKFNERDPDIFFSLFESVADDRGWSDSERTLLLQSVLVGRAQEAFIALPVLDRKKYVKVKEAVLKSYELVPEAYRLRFRS